jgi:replicative DNA helicase
MSDDQTRNPPPATPLRLVSDQGDRVLPANDAAEQALLGALFIDNRAYHRVEGLLRAEHFSRPVHGRIYTTIGQVIALGRKANPASLKHIFEGEEALRLPAGRSIWRGSPSARSRSATQRIMPRSSPISRTGGP